MAPPAQNSVLMNVAAAHGILTHMVDQPKAVAIILGHLGVTKEQLQRYSAWYVQRGCSTVAVGSPVPRFMLNWSLRPTAQAVIQTTAAVLKDHRISQAVHPQSGTTGGDSPPVVVHLFSNGGAFLLDEMEILLTDPTLAVAEDHVLVKNQMASGYQFFDSCPCYIRMPGEGWRGDSLTRAFPHPHWSSWGRRSYTYTASISLTLWCVLTGAWNKPFQFWQRMEESTLCPRQIYMYTTTDLLTDASALDDLISSRKQRFGDDLKTTVYRWEDSDHCRLARDHPEEYGQAIDQALESILSTKTAK